MMSTIRVQCHICQGTALTTPSADGIASPCRQCDGLGFIPMKVELFTGIQSPVNPVHHVIGKGINGSIDYTTFVQHATQDNKALAG